jgi:hypothetical protein
MEDPSHSDKRTSLGFPGAHIGRQQKGVYYLAWSIALNMCLLEAIENSLAGHLTQAGWLMQQLSTTLSTAQHSKKWKTEAACAASGTFRTLAVSIYKAKGQSHRSCMMVTSMKEICLYMNA